MIAGKCEPRPAPPPAGDATFGHLQIETDALAIDQHRSGVDQLLPRAIVTLVAAQCGKGKKNSTAWLLAEAAALTGARWIVL